MKTNHIYVGDNVETLKTLPDESVDMCITSPPYYNLRDYKNKDQIGSESTVTDFVDGLIEVFDEIYRVMKPTGSCWVNIGDTYSDKKLLQVPSRFEIAMSDAGWSLRNEIIWNKPNPQPISSKDRFWSNHEKIFWFVKKTKGYYFDREQIQVPQAEVSVRRMFSNNNLEKRKDAGATEKEGFSLSSGSQDKHYARMRESLNIEKDFDYDELIASGKCPSRPMFSVWDISTTSPYLNSFLQATSSIFFRISFVKYFVGSLLIVLPNAFEPSGNSILVETCLNILYFNAKSNRP